MVILVHYFESKGVSFFKCLWICHVRNEPFVLSISSLPAFSMLETLADSNSPVTGIDSANCGCWRETLPALTVGLWEWCIVELDLCWIHHQYLTVLGDSVVWGHLNLQFRLHICLVATRGNLDVLKLTCSCGEYQSRMPGIYLEQLRCASTFHKTHEFEVQWEGLYSRRQFDRTYCKNKVLSSLMYVSNQFSKRNGVFVNVSCASCWRSVTHFTNLELWWKFYLYNWVWRGKQAVFRHDAPAEVRGSWHSGWGMVLSLQSDLSLFWLESQSFVSEGN